MRKISYAAVIISAAMLMTAASCGKDRKSSSATPNSGDTHEDMSEQELKVAVIENGNGKLDEALAEYDNANDKVRLSITRYSYEDMQYTDAFNQLTREMLAGDCPDVVIAPPEGVLNMQRNGYLADLTPYMESSDTVKPDDLLPNVRQAMNCDGTIPYVFPCFFYETYVSNEKNLGSEYENWSYDEAMAAYENADDRSRFPQGPTLWRYFLRNAGCEAIDFDSMSCDFSGDFRRTMDFLMKYPFDPDDYEYKDMNDDTANSLCLTGISGINMFAAADTYGLFGGEPVTFTGYPSADGSGAFAAVDHLWAVPEYSGNKDAAWALIENFFRLSEQKKMSLEYLTGVPVTESALQALVYDTPAYVGMSLRSELLLPDSDEKMFITDEAAEKLLDYSRSVRIELGYGNELDNMIGNEWQEVMHGNVSVEECINELNNKVGLYLSERK